MGKKRVKASTLATARAEARLSAPTKKAVTAIVKRQIARQTENKVVGFNLEQNVIHNSSIADADVVPILGSILEGTSSLQRIGDRVKPKRLTVRGIVGLNPENNPNNKPMIVSVYILACKDKKTNALVQAGAGMADLLKPNINGTEQVPFDGTTLRNTYPVNTEKFRVYYQKKFRIAPGTLATGTREYDFFRWGYTFKQSKMPASLTWDEATGDDCNNFAPFMVIGYSYTDGTAPDVLATRLISNTSSEFTFEDA